MRSKCVGAILVFAMGLYISGTSSYATTKKESGSVTIDGEVNAEWRHIVSITSQTSFESRRLYKDGESERLVIRISYNQSTGATYTIEQLSTGDTLTIDKVVDAVNPATTLSSGGVSASVDAYALSQMPEGQLPVAFKQQGEVLANSLSQSFRDALYRLAVVGCYETTDLYSVSFLFGPLFFDEISCDSVPSEKGLLNLKVVNPFDSAVISPDSFELEFGPAYYQ